jgi:hypothetical protein
VHTTVFVPLAKVMIKNHYKNTVKISIIAKESRKKGMGIYHLKSDNILILCHLN